MIPLASQCHALAHTVGFADLPRSQVQITGADRAQLLHGLCTNDIKQLQPGQGCEAFLTNVQGKIIGYVYVFCDAESLVLDSVWGEATNLIQNLDRYVVREKVRFIDQSTQWRELLVSGSASPEPLSRIVGSDVPRGAFEHRQISYQGEIISLRRTPLAGANSFQLSGSPVSIDLLRGELAAGGAQMCEAESVEIARIEAGTPLFGRDITTDTLPQEVDRNRAAISFTKGCYLGQETVARIDALGHVNRLLRGLKFVGPDLPPEGAEIIANGKTVAKTTSVCFSSRLESPLALAYVRRGQHEPGTRFASQYGQVEVVGLPIS